MMNMEQVKAEEKQTEILTMIQQMGKYPDFHEFTHPPSSSSFSHQNPNPIFPQPACNYFQPTIHNHHHHPSSSSSSTQKQNNNNNSMAAMREMIYRIAAMQPIHIDPESVKRPKRRNVKISKDPQSVAARLRREKISERIRILQRIVPGGTKMDTASMLDEAIHYVKFLKNQLHSLENAASAAVYRPVGLGFPVPVSGGGYLSTSLYVSDEEEVGDDD